ncbi:MAG: hypothetical protein IAF02_16010 [Anaerolineae bacterium]|nr:hypothetical protein [Anaerolineae bacterium]
MKRITITTLFIIMILFVVGGLYSANTAQSQEIPVDALEPPLAVQSPTNTLFSYQGQLLDAGGIPITNATMPMIFKLYPVLTGGTACWSENQTVNVQNGQFNVLIGKVTPIPGACLTGDIYLELVVNGETLTPRELLTSAAHAVEASTLPHEAITGGLLNIASGPDGEGGQITLLPGTTGNEWELDNRFGTFRLHHSGKVYFSIKPDGTVNLNNNTLENFGGLSSNQADTAFTNDIGNFRWKAAESIFVFLDTDNNQTDRSFIVSADSSYFGGGAQPLFRVDETKETTVYGFLDVQGIGNASMEIGQVTSGGNMYLDLTKGSAIVFRDRTVSPSKEMFNVKRNGDTTIYGNLDLRGSCLASALSEGNGIASADGSTCTGGSLTTGAVIEANLQTPEELQSDKISRFSLGDLLCWSPETDQLELCTTLNDRLVMAVANNNGKPIVMGAEPIKVIGTVQAGDILVTSETPGYAMVNNNPAPGTVIGQALEDFNGESGRIKAMIRKW